MIRVAEKWRWPLLLTAAFVISRIAYYRAGVRFDLSPLFGYWQYVDLDLLRHDLVRSVYYLHSQPPLFNLYLGLVVKVFGGRWARDAFWASYRVSPCTWRCTSWPSGCARDRPSPRAWSSSSP
jgi:hypothetical protein